MAINVLFLCYWSLSDGLTQATVLPHLRVLQQYKKITSIRLVTIERQSPVELKPLPTELHKVLHEPLFPVNFLFNTLTKINDFVLFPKILAHKVKEQHIDVVIAHGAPAGALAYKVWQKTKVPFYVSSFEPHAAYMLETGVWGAVGFKYIFQKRWEEQQKKYAMGLMPVAENYSKKIVEEGVSSDKVVTVPCVVALDSIHFKLAERNKLRKQLRWEQAVIGVYAGKYGGLYYEDEAFKIYQQCFQLIPGFRLIILTPQPKEEIRALLTKHHIDAEKVHVSLVPHQLVSNFLSAADFAFATIKTYPSAQYCSPIKIGEYWACGLPVMLTKGVGDDSNIIQSEGGGALFDLREPDSVAKAIARILEIIKEPDYRDQIRKLAIKYRSPDKLKEAYAYFFGNQEDGE